MATRRKDQYVNKIKAAVTMSAANTLTFSEIEVGLNLFDKVGLVIHRLEYFLSSSTKVEVIANTDSIQIGLVASNQITSIGSTERSVYDKLELQGIVSGTPGNYIQEMEPYVHDFTTFPMQGILVPPKPLYVAMDSGGLAVAGVGYLHITFTIKELSDSEYFELLETYRFFE